MSTMNDGSPDFVYESEMLNKVSRSFALTIPELPADLKRAVTNAYLICRIIDTIEDDENLTLENKFFFFEEFIKVLHDGVPAGHFADGLFPLLADKSSGYEKSLVRNTPVVIRGMFSLNPRQQQAIRRCAEIMIRGMLECQQKKTLGGLENILEFERYCYFVAGVVGEMLTDMFCDYSPEIDSCRMELMRLAVSFGQGLQMTNILKDLWEDRSRGICWLPCSVFKTMGYDLNDLSSGYSASFGRGLAEIIKITRGHLEEALTFATLIPPEESGIRKFCLWAIGIAIFTLRNINKRLDYRSGEDVKISRGTLRSIILVTNVTRRSNFLLERIFNLTTRNLGLPPEESK